LPKGFCRLFSKPVQYAYDPLARVRVVGLTAARPRAWYEEPVEDDDRPPPETRANTDPSPLGRTTLERPW
jgi:hypothetical protein